MKISDKLEYEVYELNQMNKIYNELEKLNQNINSCIDIVSSSSVSPKNHLEELKIDNQKINHKSFDELENMMNSSKRDIKKLIEEEQEKKEKEAEEEEDL